MRVTILSEDTAHANLIGEHGFSAYIEPDSGEPILFDTGQGAAILHNAPLVGIDLSRVSRVAISHGHYDHTGGLLYLLSLPRERALEVYLHPSALNDKMEEIGETLRYRFVGMPLNPGLFRTGDAFLRQETEPVELGEGLILTGEVPRRCEFEEPPKGFVSATAPDFILERDHIPDDQSLIIRRNGWFALISGCGHAGVINSLEYGAELTGEQPRIVIGGLHLISASEERIAKTVERMREMGVEKVYLGHCTGWKALRAFEDAYGEGFKRLHVGMRIEI